MLLAESGYNIHRGPWHNTLDHLVDHDLHSERRMENDTDRRTGPEYRQDHFRDKSVHDDPDLNVTHRRRFQKKHVYDATVGGSGYHPSDWTADQRDLHVHHVLRESRNLKWYSVAHNRPHSCRDLHVSVAGGVQLLPAAQVRQAEQQDGSLRQAVQLPTTLKRTVAEYHVTRTIGKALVSPGGIGLFLIHDQDLQCNCCRGGEGSLEVR